MHNTHSFSRCTNVHPRILFLVVWVIGLVLGFFFAMKMPDEALSVIRTIRNSDVSFAGLLVSLLLPFALSVVALWFHFPLVILPLAFIKAFAYSFCASVLMRSFGEAGWLIYRLYLFSDSCMSVVFIWFWNRNICQITDGWKKDSVLCLIISVFVFCIDFSFVTPLLKQVFKY